jgi:oxidase EvaA
MSKSSTVPPSGSADSAAALELVLDRSRRNFVVEQVRAAEADDWSLREGALQHRSGGFFSVVGIRDGAGETVMLYQPQAAITGAITARIDGERHLLLQARAEPGCIGSAQFGPTVQSTPANFMRLHGGAATPLIDAFIGFDPSASILGDTVQLDLGERYLCKSKRSIVVETDAPPTPPPAFVWASPEAIRQAVLRSAFLNIDLRSIVSVMDWSDDPDCGELSPVSPAARKSLSSPIRAEVIGEIVAQMSTRVRAGTRFVPLHTLENWRETEWGWSERDVRQGFSIDFFKTSAPYREKASWTQPLVNSSSEGHVVLACRERSGLLEMLVRVAPERGLVTGAALGPSHVRYPGAAGDAPGWLASAKVWASSRESDEGGRFFRDASLYELVRMDDADTETGPGFWLRLSELKLFLRMSNTCTIQLRGIASHLLAAP